MPHVRRSVLTSAWAPALPTFCLPQWLFRSLVFPGSVSHPDGWVPRGGRSRELPGGHHFFLTATALLVRWFTTVKSFWRWQRCVCSWSVGRSQSPLILGWTRGQPHQTTLPGSRHDSGHTAVTGRRRVQLHTTARRVEVPDPGVILKKANQAFFKINSRFRVKWHQRSYRLSRRSLAMSFAPRGGGF